MARGISDYKITDKQLVLLAVVMEGTGSTIHAWLDIDQVIEKLGLLGWTVTKSALKFTIKSMVARRLIEDRVYEGRQTTRGVKEKLILAGTQKGRERYEASIKSGALKRALDSLKA